MGNWYTNVSLKGATQSDVVSLLEELGRRAYVTPETDGWVVVYDEESNKFDLGTSESLALTLSHRLSCTTFASFNADDDILWLGAYEDGRLTARYASQLQEFEDAADFPSLDEVSRALCRIFEKPGMEKRVLRILRTSFGPIGLLYWVFKIRFAYLFEIHRHLDLAALLGIPSASVGFGYRYVERGETPEGMTREQLRRTMVG